LRPPVVALLWNTLALLPSHGIGLADVVMTLWVCGSIE
jgi:hypothetical protein